MEGHSNSVSCLAQLSDGRVVSGSCDNTLKVWNVATVVCEQTLEGHSDPVYCLLQIKRIRIQITAQQMR